MKAVLIPGAVLVVIVW